MPQQGHLIVPATEEFRLYPFQKIQRIAVVLKNEDAHQIGGYGDDADFMLSKSQVEELGSARDVSIVDSKMLESKHENIILWQVTIEAEGANGRPRQVKKTYELDLRIREIDGVDGSYIVEAIGRARIQAGKAKAEPSKYYKAWTDYPDEEAPPEEWEKWIRDQAMKSWTMTNRHRVSRAETGASLRAMRTMLKIKSSYKKKDFQIPWIIIRQETDWERAIAYGGPVGEMAMKMLGISMTRQLGLSDTTVAGLLEGVKIDRKVEDVSPKDLFPAEEEEIEVLVDVMVKAGFPNRAACDQRTMDLFDLPVSQLTRRHVNIMHEYVHLSAVAKDNLEPEEFIEYREQIKAVVQICYAEGSMIEDTISQELWDTIHKVEEKTIDGEAEIMDEGEVE